MTEPWGEEDMEGLPWAMLSGLSLGVLSLADLLDRTLPYLT
jgi:hypothetical protein